MRLTNLLWSCLLHSKPLCYSTECRCRHWRELGGIYDARTAQKPLTSESPHRRCFSHPHRFCTLRTIVRRSKAQSMIRAEPSLPDRKSHCRMSRQVSPTKKTTNDSGSVHLDFVEPGTYTLTAEQTGFSKFQQENFTVQVRADITINPVLNVGGRRRASDRIRPGRCGEVQHLGRRFDDRSENVDRPSNSWTKPVPAGPARSFCR